MEHIIESCGKMYRIEALIKKDRNIMIAAIAFLAVLIGSLVWIYQINNTNGTSLNLNADTAAGEVAGAVDAEKLIKELILIL